MSALPEPYPAPLPPVTSPPVAPSAAPVRPPGTRSRAGNAMARTRAAVLQGAAECIARQGVRKTTMGDIATRSRIAKATLYNHFRTKDDLLLALVDAEVRRLAADCAEEALAHGLAGALRLAASRLAANPALRRVADHEPAMLAALASAGDGPGWDAARAGVAGVLTAVGRDATAGAVETVLRWLVGQLGAPLAPELADAAVTVFVRGLAMATPLPTA